MSGNRAIVYLGPKKIAVQKVDYPKLEDASTGKKIEHGVILKVVATTNLGKMTLDFGKAWIKSPTLSAGRTPGHEVLPPTDVGDYAGTDAILPRDH